MDRKNLHSLARILCRTATLAVLLLFPLSCTSGSKTVSIGNIYSQAAQQYEYERNPVIVIPGILGSRLRDAETDASVWGSFLGGFANPNDEMGLRRVSLPLAVREELNQVPTTVLPDGVLGRVRVSLLGLPLELNAYHNILQTLGLGGYRDRELAESGAIDYGAGHFTCFQFSYDWRRDISFHVKRLHEYLLEEKRYVEEQLKEQYGVERDVKFTIVAHSMGGLLARYYLRYGSQVLPDDGGAPALTWEGASLIDHLILVGTPSGGSAFAFADLLNGKDLGPVIPTYPAAVLGTMPAVYQILPRSRHARFRFDDGERISNILEPSLWEQYEWGVLDPSQDYVLRALLPDKLTRESRLEAARAHLLKVLKRAEQFQRAVDRPATAPSGLRISLFAGDAIETAAAIEIDRKTGKARLVDPLPGDGLVTRASALLDERPGQAWTPRLETPIPFGDVTFLSSDHLGLTEDRAFVNNLLYSLLESPKQ